MAADVEHVVNAPRDGEVTRFRITNRTVACEVILTFEVVRVVALFEALGVAPNVANHAGPGFLDDQDAALSIGYVFAGFVNDGGLNAGERQGARARNEWRGTGQRSDHVATGFGLPEGIHDGAAATANVLVVPGPRRWVDGLTHRTQDAQGTEVVVLRVHGLVRLRRFDERTNRRRRGIKNSHVVFFDHLPEAACIWVGWNTFKHNFGCPQGQRAIGDVGVAGDPADIGCAPEDIVGLQVEGPLGGQHGVQQVAAAGMLHAFGFACGARGVEQKQRMLSAHPLRLTGGGLGCDHLMQPQVAAGLKAHVASGAAVNDDVFDAVTATQTQGFIDDGFERQVFAAAHLFVGGEHHHGTRVFYAVTQGLRRKTTEHDGMGGTNTRTSLHGHYTLHAHGHVDDDAVAFFDPFFAQCIGQLTSFCK